MGCEVNQLLLYWHQTPIKRIRLDVHRLSINWSTLASHRPFSRGPKPLIFCLVLYSADFTRRKATSFVGNNES